MTWRFSVSSYISIELLMRARENFFRIENISSEKVQSLLEIFFIKSKHVSTMYFPLGENFSRLFLKIKTQITIFLFGYSNAIFDRTTSSDR